MQLHKRYQRRKWRMTQYQDFLEYLKSQERLSTKTGFGRRPSEMKVNLLRILANSWASKLGTRVFPIGTHAKWGWGGWVIHLSWCPSSLNLMRYFLLKQETRKKTGLKPADRRQRGNSTASKNLNKRRMSFSRMRMFGTTPVSKLCWSSTTSRTSMNLMSSWKTTKNIFRHYTVSILLDRYQPFEHFATRIKASALWVQKQIFGRSRGAPDSLNWSQELRNLAKVGVVEAGVKKVNDDSNIVLSKANTDAIASPPRWQFPCWEEPTHLHNHLRTQLSQHARLRI